MSVKTVSIEYTASWNKALKEAEAEITALKDLAVADINMLIVRKNPCKICKHKFQDYSAEVCLPCNEITPYGNFEWRGIKDD